MIQEDLISIIIPIYNTENYLRTCLDSVIAQTYTNFEAILVDDGSTDGSGAICDEYHALDNRLVVFHRQNHGVGQSRNYALDQAKGDYIAFIDSDDIYHPQFLEILYNALKQTSHMVAMSGFDGVEENESLDLPLLDNPKGIDVQRITQAEVVGYMTGKNRHNAKRNTPTVTSFHSMANKLYHRALFDNRRFTRDIAEDSEMNLSIFLEVPSIAYVSNVLYFYTKRTGSLSRSCDYRIMVFAVNNYFDTYQKLLQNKYPVYEKWFIGNYFLRFLSRRAIVKGTEVESESVSLFNELSEKYYPDFVRLIPCYQRVIWNFLWKCPQLCHWILISLPLSLKSLMRFK